MKSRFTSVGASLLLTLGCGSQVEIGHGTEPGTGGRAGAPAPTGTGGKAPEPAPSPGAGGEPDMVGPSAPANTPGSLMGKGLTGGPAPADAGPQAEATKVDLLLAIDNSISMAEKQQLLAKTMPDLVKRLVNPYCVNSRGAVVAQPASPAAACPNGSQREFEPLTDLHVGVITSSLGSHGAAGVGDLCAGANGNDHAHLIPFVRSNVESYHGKGFLKWDPKGVASPPGESDVLAFADSLQKMIASVGEQGCGYEAQLESVYRFLVDPDPPQSVAVPSGQTVAAKVGIDQELLKERADFLRPDSSVVVLMLTDENDCSIVDEGYGWLVAHAAPMFRSTSACLGSPNDPCCQSCAETTRNAGCAPFEQDSECRKGSTLPADQDNPNLRCFEQKARFGFDLRYPTSRYISAFGGGTVRNRKGELVANPLFEQGRDPSLFTLAVIAGVPWQDLATPDSLAGDSLQFLTSEQLASSNRWPVILGDPSTNTPPTDPFMLESTEERRGKNPITGAQVVPSSATSPQANAINGHEQANLASSDLQYACTFALPQPLVCDEATAAGKGCDCFADALDFNRPLCQPPAGGPAGTTQYYGKAYPGLRELEVAQKLGRRAVLGSACARNTQDNTRTDYGYRPLFGALGKRIAATLVKP